MVGQIHAAQKVRDEAMMSRIKLANEERDAALTHSRTLMEKLSVSPQATSSTSCSALEIPEHVSYVLILLYRLRGLVLSVCGYYYVGLGSNPG